MAIVGKWFTRRLGPAMGVFTVLLAIGFMASIPALGYAVKEYGWRAAWSGLGLVVVFGLAPLGGVLVRSTPRTYDLALEPQPTSSGAAPETAHGVSLGGALCSPAFWSFSLASAWFGLAWSAITLSNQKILTEHGFDNDDFILIMALLAASGLPANLIGGWLATRWPLGRLAGIGMMCFVASLVVFPSVATLPAAVGYALLLGAAGGLITVIFFTFYGHAFGRAHLGHIQGAAQVLTVVASAAGPWLLEQCWEWTGSYDFFFYATALVAALLGLAAWQIRFRPATIQP
jgi:MFS family permease